MKCLNCNSSRIIKSKTGFKCKRCGFTNISLKEFIKQEIKDENNKSKP
jgi:tRNA(Ile2) C34 agmatinyltransferase TiaS